LTELSTKKNSKRKQEIMFILILAAGVVVFSVFWGWSFTYHPPPDWKDVIPGVSGDKSTNITTGTFNVTVEQWSIVWWPSGSSPLDKCAIEIYNASSDVKLQEFTLATNGQETSVQHAGAGAKGSYYLKIQVYDSVEYEGSWYIRVLQYRPEPPYEVWIGWIVVIGIAAFLVYIGYASYKVLRE